MCGIESESSNLGNIFWLASYPKSGNTWVRAFISNLQQDLSCPVDINHFNTGRIASSRELISEALDFDINELDHDEIDALRPDAYLWLSSKMDKPGYNKIHDAYTFVGKNKPLIPNYASRGILYIVRNPLDVAVSFSHHSQWTLDETIKNMGDHSFCFSGATNKLTPQLRQKLLSWSGHVTSWLSVGTVPLMLVKYEDLKRDPVTTFTRIAKFLDLDTEEKKIHCAIAHCDITELQAQEEEKSFKEKPCKVSNFFRKGVVGDWKTVLNESQVCKIIEDHGEVMKRLGYVDDQYRPIDIDECTNESVLSLI